MDILSEVLTTIVKALDIIMWYQWEADIKEKDRWKSINLKGRIMNTIQVVQVHVQEMEENRMDKRHRETEEKVTTTAEWMKQVHAHLGLGNIRDEQCTAKIRSGSVYLQPEQPESNLIAARFAVLRTDIEPMVLYTNRYRTCSTIYKPISLFLPYCKIA